MKNFQVLVRLKPGVLDVQGKAIERGVLGVGIENILNVRVGRLVEFTVACDDENQARKHAEKLCQELLANTIIENYEIKLL